MKLLKSISTFFFYPFVMLFLGIWLGSNILPRLQDEENKTTQIPLTIEKDNNEKIALEKETSFQSQTSEFPTDLFQEVSTMEDTLTADTEYILEEKDLIKGSTVETIWRIPAKYIGMNRQLFLEAMEQYEAAPPLSEKERGFLNLEVLQFSRERVVIQMNYQFIQPSTSFYLAANNNEVVVLLEDQQTVYIYTGILLNDLPEETRNAIIQMMYVENEAKLYDLLENYSS